MCGNLASVVEIRSQEPLPFQWPLQIPSFSSQMQLVDVEDPLAAVCPSPPPPPFFYSVDSLDFAARRMFSFCVW